MIDFDCPNCRQRISVPESAGGHMGVCPRCHAKVQVPQGGAGAKEAGAAGAGGNNAAGRKASPDADDGAQMVDCVTVETRVPEETRVPCPFCHEFIAPKANKCRFCGRQVRPYPPAGINSSVNPPAGGEAPREAAPDNEALSPKGHKAAAARHARSPATASSPRPGRPAAHRGLVIGLGVAVALAIVAQAATGLYFHQKLETLEKKLAGEVKDAKEQTKAAKAGQAAAEKQAQEAANQANLAREQKKTAETKMAEAQKQAQEAEAQADEAERQRQAAETRKNEAEKQAQEAVAKAQQAAAQMKTAQDEAAALRKQTQEAQAALAAEKQKNQKLEQKLTAKPQAGPPWDMLDPKTNEQKRQEEEAKKAPGPKPKDNAKVTKEQSTAPTSDKGSQPQKPAQRGAKGNEQKNNSDKSGKK